MQSQASGFFASQSTSMSRASSIRSAGGQPPLSANSLGVVPGQQQQQQQQGNVRPAILPDRTVTETTIEDAYVSFILACNPAVSPATDTTALREAFRTPPRSDGKNFSIFTLYQLICQLEEREIKTWAELALKLGVDPPDQDKGQSSQKIQQYAVRLKRWMHSMHANAFFDYLMDRPHPYWTDIPTSPYSVSEHLRDGVAAKDDMALRALIPEIKPRRGRRRPDDDSDQDTLSNHSSSHRPRLDDYVDDLSAPGSGTSLASRWSTQSDSRYDFGVPLSHAQETGPHYVSPPEMSGFGPNYVQAPTPVAGWSASLDGMGTSLSEYPQSGIMPSARTNYWADEPKPAAAGSSAGQSSRRPGRRYGAKVVSSAWRSSGTGGSGKTRGRPPINRNGHHHNPNAQEPFSHQTSVVNLDRTAAAFPIVTSSYASHMEPTTAAPLPTMQLTEMNVPTTSSLSSPIPLLTLSDSMSSSSTTAPSRSNYPNHLPFQVPSKQGTDICVTSPSSQRVADPISSFGMHPPFSPPSTRAISEKSLSLTSYGTGTLDLPLNMNFAPDATAHHSETPSLGATHPPVAATNVGSATTEASSVTPEIATNSRVNKHEEGRQLPQMTPKAPPMYSVHFGTGETTDRTNIAEIEAYFMTEVFAAAWYDENDQRIEPCSVEEASALVDSIVEGLTKGAACKEAFLINLAALAGSRLLMANTGARIKRLEQTTEYTKYDFAWELRFGDVCGQFNITEAVEHARWKKMTADVKASVARAVGLKTEAEERPQQPYPPTRSTGSDGSHPTSLEGGRMHFPTQSNNLDDASRYEDMVTGTVPAVNPDIQSYCRTADFMTSGIGYGMPMSAPLPTAGAALGSAGGSLPATASPTNTNTQDEILALAALWEKKYRNLLHLLYKRDRQLDRTRCAVLQGLQGAYEYDDIGDI
ncbi:ars-binding protein [Sporothrix brasiliensis 5110]|uniref:Ars-binding protein n=1 Tax=Sporothrix brasiliensis 5110 TaxID=1398154 RepID=A0A0C2J313_9PEZI|nr:ars-binding protein [Sporothrix brasiliensis 5110]KIH91457.1 ars-binding protein [Sporothrix brasiliensis 5110]